MSSVFMSATRKDTMKTLVALNNQIKMYRGKQAYICGSTALATAGLIPFTDINDIDLVYDLNLDRFIKKELEALGYRISNVTKEERMSYGKFYRLKGSDISIHLHPTSQEDIAEKCSPINILTGKLHRYIYNYYSQDEITENKKIREKRAISVALNNIHKLKDKDADTMNNIQEMIIYLKAYHAQNTDVADSINQFSFKYTDNGDLSVDTKNGNTFVLKSNYKIPDKESDVSRDYRLSSNIIKFQNEPLPKEALNTWC